MEPGYCCDLTICTAPTTIRCPRNTVEIDNECICYFGSCHIPLCPANYSAIVSRYATGVMGDCCDQHICVPNPSCPPDMAVIDGKCECLPCKDPFCPHGLEPVLLPEDKEKCCQPFECNKVSCPPGMLLSPDLTTCMCDTQICPVPSCLDSQVLKTVHNSDECCPSYLCVELTCHADSILIDGNCVCAPEYCQTPDCPSGKLEILQWATHQPGSCCDIFTCHGSALKPTQQPAKCPPFTRPSSNGICECDCDLCPFPPMCPPGYAPAIIKHPLMTPGSCCVEYACMPVLPDCPRDSYIQNKICQCFPCNDSPQTCSDGTSLILLKKGDGRPGSCCDVYACKEHPSCTLGGVVSADLGLKCVCQKSLCPLPSCDPTSAVRIVHKASGTYPDCCNTYACFISDCPPDSIMVDGECVCAVSNRVQPCLPGLVPVVTRRGIGKPGNCGTEVVCEQPKSLDAPCPPFSIKLPDGNCVCKKDLCPDSVCPTGFSRVVLSEAKNILGLCCPEYTCIKIITCPPDSYALGDTCVCQPCPKPTCNDGSSPIIDSPGQKTPNMCCDTYHCAAATSTVCPLGSTISPDGKTCLCNASPPLSYCEPGFTFVTVQYATNIYPDCYDEVACIKLECPSDSILIDDECRCRTCEVPTCAPGSYAELVSPGFDVPGQCCGTYECNLSASVVQCPPYMIQLSDGSCHCSPKSCPMISCPSGLSTAVLSTSSCCPEFICQQSIVCPDDSYVEDNACNCLPCPVKTCQDGSSLIPIRSGNNVPGSCCDEFICAGVQTCETGFVMDVTGRCICNKHQCFIPTCSGNSTAVISRYAKENECCDKIACIEFTCPTDSFLVGSKCVCLPCQKPLCPFGTEFFNFKQRKGVPGECCDQWICKEIIPPLTSTICGKFEILVNDKCECSMDLCSAPACPPNTTTILLESDSCCPEYTCGFAFAMDCPPDSYLLDKECECYPCLEPKCPGVLEVKSHGDNRPGSCCSVYDCKEKLICPAGSIFSEAANACICDSTTCDQPKCSFGQIAILGMPSGQYPECCPKYVCMEVECPPDSLMGAYGCFCIPNYCPQNFCPQNSREILVKRASGQPGDCCDSYECQEFVIRTGCPSDSKRSPSGCVCNECTVPECTHGAVPIVMLNGTGVPGNCCPQYACFKATCPEDSYASHDECHCLPCREQVCPSGTPKTISSGDGTPGACCPVVECDESHPCPSGTKYDGSNCVCDYELCTSPQCPPGTQMLVINQTIDQINCCPDYACSCPPGQELVGGVCECSICKDQLCPSGTQKIIVRYATGVNGDCCNEIMCQEHQTIICPIDSDRTSSGCVCSGSCTETTCPANMTRIVVVEATNVPGNCCPQHSCVKPISCAVDSYWNTSGCVCLPCSEQLCEGKEEIILRGNGQPGTCCDHKICNRTEKKSNCPYKSKMGPNGTCICDTDSCSMPVCGEGYSMVLVEESLAYPDCCPEYACIATCPPDSWQSDGACQCIECSYLSCPDSTYAVVETRGMGIPGKCCDTIVCKTGQIRCPPYTEFVNGYCQCSLDLCESPPACPTDHTLIIVRMPNNFIGDCCPEYACYPHLEPCPGDSYNMNGQCICYACPTVESMLCPNGMVPTAAQNGNQQPGSCCDEYVCGSFCPRGSIYQNVTDQCICDTKLCPVPPCNASTTMAVVQDASGVYPDCCDEYACLTLDCPADSIIENQECVCANVCQPEQCSPGMELVIMQEGKNIPGECCEITSCQEVKPDSVKPCPPNSIRLSNGSCGCIPDLCPPSPKCLEGTQLTILYQSQNECCPDVICSVIHECPPDSYLISGRCECLPCIQYECPPNTNIVVHRSETNSPGQCCDDYECIADQSGQAVECLRGAVLNKAGKSCVCDESSCEVPSCPNDMEIIIVAYSDKVYPECCNVFGCIHVQCPPDSELIDGICKCKRKCDIPSCPPGTVLVKESMAHGTPGKCCDNWSCDQKKSLNLVCPPNMKLIDNNCTCDKSTCSSPRCPPGTTPMAYIEQSGSPADCCPEWTCYQEIISCPPDSYLQNDECVCQPCMPPPACDNKIVSESKGEPGSCCSVYECMNVENTCNSCPDIACDAGLELRLLSTPSGVYPDCCPRHACILNECPRDSFMARNGQCVCIPAYCASITCPQGTTRVIIKRAKGEPGACCDEILCLEADSTKEPTDKNESPTCPPFMKWAPEQTCVCAQELCPPKPMCPPGTISIIYKHPSKISGDCCPQYTCISALPDCPGDSYFLNGTCACYPCPSPPPCPQGQKVVESGDGRPGSCCSEYQCEETHAECTCPYGQTAGPDCTCVCSKKRCNRPVCEQGSVPRVIISATMVVPDCCDVIACVEFNCPPDSLLNAEGECVCMENYCSSFSCPDGSERIILSPAKNIPGQCCDAIVCDVTVALCPLGTTLTSYGVCECLIEVCPLPPDCPHGSSLFLLDGDVCCPQYGCYDTPTICPPDSYNVNDRCECLPCRSHDCQGKLVTLQRGNGMPGTCCPKTVCEEENAICPLGTRVTKDGQCKCETSQCTKPSCDSDFMLVVIRKATQDVPDCCDTFACFEAECPIDSIATSSGECMCLPNACHPPPCWPGSRLVKILRGFGIPGKCCDKWMCEQAQDQNVIACPPFHVYQDGLCTCEESYCPPKPICPEGFTAMAHQAFSCCPEYFCFPLLTDCPGDSYYDVDGTCKCYPCNQSSCPEGFETVLSMLGNKYPGSCCDVHTCQLFMPDYDCGPCGVMQTDGQCACSEGCCAASPPCPDGVLVISKTSTGLYPDCCDKYACIRKVCPANSILDEKGNCICQTCPEPKCPSGTVQIDVAPTGEPGNCCGTWSCKTGIEKSCPEPPSCSMDYQLVHVDTKSGCKIFECKRVECPSDSVNVNGMCYCDVSRCPSKYCGIYEIMISVRKSTNSPGDCCDQVMCLANYCPPYHVYDAELESCVCAPSLCPPTPQCGNRRLLVDVSIETERIWKIEGCCFNYACGVSLACPFDSQPNAQNTGCVCDYRNCVVPTCLEGETLLEVLPLSSTPGFCCPAYLCKVIIECPWDSKMVNGPDSELYCECDPLRCPPQSCPHHAILYVTSRSVGTPGSCCSNSECETVPCPPYTTQDEFGNCICKCELCPPPSCSIGFSIVIISECGTPPFCCPQFECIKQEVSCQFGEIWVDNECQCKPETCQLPKCCTILLPLLPGQCCHPCICLESEPQCPPDSYFDSLTLTCACLPCQKISCSSSAVVTKPGTSKPGSCCPQYTCSYQKLCPPGSVLDGTDCICNPDSCPHPLITSSYKMIVSHVSSGKFPDCCDEVLVIPDLDCPSDAIMYHNGACYCPECPDPSCPPGSTPYIVRRAAGVPGQCCEVYQCKVITQVCPDYAFENNGACECRADRCYRPSCSPGFMLVETNSSTNVYPDCCPTYECTIIPICPCDSRLNRLTGKCICDPTLCPVIQCPNNETRVIVREASGSPGDCCNSYLCMRTVVCPADSRIEGDECVCDKKRCREPTCDANFTLVELRVGKDTPGACCSHYECRLIQCPYGTRYDQISESCVCDRERCVVPECHDGSVLIKQKEATLIDNDCCDSYVCQWVLVKCPPDSKRHPLTGHCECSYPSCPPVKCSDSFQPVITREPQNIPGQCCPSFECRQTVICPIDSKPNINGICVCSKNCSASIFQCKEGMSPVLKEPKTGMPGQCCDVYSCSNKCPVDSMVDESGECVCDMASCSDPICPDGMVSFVVALSSGVPGECCNKHQCHFQCPRDSRYNESLGSCSCHLRSCSEAKCPDSLELKIISQPTGKPGRCCVEFECIAPCPDDSVWDARSKSCVCAPCKKFNCPQGQHAAISWAGSNTPGECCPKYNCTTSITIQCSEFAVVNENNACTCVPSLCPKKSCDDAGSRLIEQDSFIDANNCCPLLACEPISCPPDSVLSEEGECLCDFAKCKSPGCPTPFLRGDRVLPVPGSCCLKYSCNNSTLVDQEMED
ncbi:VWC [Nesidiocoris tenuis]|nr:VWC [Nesidiocoris tenuis]